ncbi:MAG: GH3 auxin-responsive promoter family protein [Myxococcota bacterium]|jgi:hypothetical protein
MVRKIWDDILPAIPPGAISTLGKLLFSRSWIKFEKAAAAPVKAQGERLAAILGRNSGTVFGREHNFSAIRTPEQFRASVPVRDWSGFEPYINRMTSGERNVLVAGDVLFFGRTSGTSGTPKYIPVTQEYIDEYLLGRRVWMRQVIASFPGLVRGKLLTVHSTGIEGRTPSGIPYGSITAPMSRSRQWSSIAGGFDEIPPDVYSIPDFEARYYCILRFALESRISVIGAINPSTIVLLARKLSEYEPQLAADLQAGSLNPDIFIDPVLRRRLEMRLAPNPAMAAAVRGSYERHGVVKLRDVWPGLCGVLSWKGGSAPFFIAQFKEWFDGIPVMDYGYGATEGNFTVPLSPEGDDGVCIPLGHYMEFIPEGMRDKGGDAALTMDRLEKGGRYHVLVTGSHGLYRYDINDVVECTGHYMKAPRLRFLHKGGSVLSVTGEKVTEQQVVEACSRAASGAAVRFAGFSCTVRMAETPYYLVGVECADGSPDEILMDFLMRFDDELAVLNLEYEAKRRSLRLGFPRLVLFSPGAFDRYRDEQVRSGAADSHVKPPHLVRDEALFGRFEIVREVGVE